MNKELSLEQQQNNEPMLIDIPSAQMPQNPLLAAALSSPALQWQSDRGGRNNYPANYRGRVPLKVKVAKKVEPDLPWLKKELGVKDDTVCQKDNEYYVWVNSYGAVSAILPNGEKLGLLPSEFDVIEWHNDFDVNKQANIIALSTEMFKGSQ
jgi:hypothetical protein